MKVFYTLLIILFPVLSVYQGPVARLSIADALLVAVFPVLILSLIHAHAVTWAKKEMAALVYAGYIAVTYVVVVAGSADANLASTFRYVLYLVSLLFAKHFFDFKLGIRALGVATNVISLYLVAQFLAFSLFSVILPWNIPGLQPMDEAFLALPDVDPFYWEFYRPTGLFLEPTHYAQFSIVYVLYCLSKLGSPDFRLRPMLFPVAGMICSGSSIAAICLLFALIYWLSVSYRRRLVAALAYAGALVVLALVLAQIPYFQSVVVRLLPTEGGWLGPAMVYRFNSVFGLFAGELTGPDWLFGKGRGTETEYYTALFYVLRAHGLVGLALFTTMLLGYLGAAGRMGRSLVYLLFLLLIGSELMVNFGVLWYLTIVAAESQNGVVVRGALDAFRNSSVFVRRVNSSV